MGHEEERKGTGLSTKISSTTEFQRSFICKRLLLFSDRTPSHVSHVKIDEAPSVSPGDTTEAPQKSGLQPCTPKANNDGPRNEGNDPRGARVLGLDARRPGGPILHPDPSWI